MDYTAIASIVNDLFAQEGVTAYLHKLGEGVYNPATGTSTAVLATATPVKIIYANKNNKWSYQFTMSEEDVIGLISTAGETPEKNDLISADGVEGTAWTILSEVVVQPTSVSLLYICHLRKQ